MMGRVTLNSLKHIDPWGSVVDAADLAVYLWRLIGWAKPCPVTLRNFKNIKRDDILTSLAGPASNLAMATIALVLLLVLKHVVDGDGMAVEAAMAVADQSPGSRRTPCRRCFRWRCCSTSGC